MKTEQQTVTWLDLQREPKNPKFFHPKSNKIYTKTQIINKIYNVGYFYDSKQDAFVDMFDGIEKIEIARIMREGIIHNLDCEFATGTHCTCWCGEKYHGLRGGNI